MKESDKILEEALNTVLQRKGLPGEIILAKVYEKGPLSSRCTVLTVYHRHEGRNTILYRWRACALPKDLQYTDPYDDAYREVLIAFLSNSEEIWNLINTKPQ